MVSVIEKYGLREKAIELIDSVDKVYTPREAADILSGFGKANILPLDYIAFRTELYANRGDRLSKELVPITEQRKISNIPDALQNMSKYSTFDTLGLRNGLASKAVDILQICTSEEREEYDVKTALVAIKTANDLCESIDKKVRALNATDPTTIAFSSEALNNLQECLLDIDREYPEFQLLLKLKIAAERRRNTTIEVTGGQN